MKILSVFDTAGVGAILSDGLVQWHGLDPFGFTEYYGGYLMPTPEHVVETALGIEKNYDRIIVHDMAQYLHKFPREKTVMMYHGASLRQMWGPYDVDKGYKVLLSTPDLTKWRPDGYVLGTPVDRKLFSPRKIGAGKLCITNKRQHELIRSIMPRDVFVRVRDENIVPYPEMPEFLAKASEYVEKRYDYLGNEMRFPSCTALQALSIGCTAQVWDKKYTSFPEECDSVKIRQDLEKYLY